MNILQIISWILYMISFPLKSYPLFGNSYQPNSIDNRTLVRYNYVTIQTYVRQYMEVTAYVHSLKPEAGRIPACPHDLLALSGEG